MADILLLILSSPLSNTHSAIIPLCEALTETLIPPFDTLLPPFFFFFKLSLMVRSLKYLCFLKCKPNSKLQHDPHVHWGHKCVIRVHIRKLWLDYSDEQRALLYVNYRRRLRHLLLFFPKTFLIGPNPKNLISPCLDRAICIAKANNKWQGHLSFIGYHKINQCKHIYKVSQGWRRTVMLPVNFMMQSPKGHQLM